MRKISTISLSIVIIVSMALGTTVFGTNVQEKQQEMNRINNEKADYSKKNQELEKAINAQALEVDKLDGEVSEQEAKISETEGFIAKKKAEMDQRKDSLNQRLRVSYKKGTVGFLDVLLSSKNVSELLSNLEFLQKIYKQDRATLDYIKKEHETLVVAENKLKAQQKTLVAKKTEAAKKKTDLEANQADIKKRLDALTSQSARIGEEIRAAEAEAERLLAEKRAQQAAQQNQANPGGSSGSSENAYVPNTSAGIGWPVRGLITCEFGWRYIAGMHDYHTGIDIAVPTGTPIRAAASGVVVTSGWTDMGYGNYVIISHGGGISTVYGHNSSLAVSAGQYVEKGQVIAYAGSTGWSYGPHCHFEVRVNGTPQNPRGYLN